MKESIYLRTSKYGDKPLTVKRLVFNQLEVSGVLIGQFRHYKRIKFCIKSSYDYDSNKGFAWEFIKYNWYEISYSNPLFYEYMKEQANE